MSNLDFPHLGLTISAIDEFIELCGGRSALVGKDTTQVNDFQKRITADVRKSYCEYLLSRGEVDRVGQASVFISHAWRYVFLEVIDALRSHFIKETGIIIWFDMFSNNQHEAPLLSFEWWSTTFKSAICSFGRTVMVLKPWDKPITLSRAWCLFEIFCTVQTGAKFEVAMSPEENSAFIRAMIADFHVMNKMIAGIDVTTSEATNPADLEQIMTVVKETIGVDTINSMVLAAIRGWMCSAAEEALSRAEVEEQEHDIIGLKLAMGSLYRGQGLVQKAECIFSECLDITTKDFGETHRQTVESMDALANCYYRQEKYDLAESFLVKCLEIRRMYYPEEHNNIVSSIGSLGALYYRKMLYTEAEVLYLESYEICKAHLGVDHPSTIKNYGGLATLYSKMKLDEKALEFYELSLKYSKLTHGPDHPSTLLSIGSLAAHLNKTGRLEEAARHSSECLRMQRIKLGNKNPMTKSSVGALASIYFKLQKFDLAALLYHESCANCIEDNGIDHPYTFSSESFLANCYAKLKRMDEAIEIYLNVLSKKRIAFGNQHKSTLCTIFDVAELYRGINNFEKALELHSECLDSRSLILEDGKVTKDTLRSLKSVSDLHFRIGNPERAFELLNECVNKAKDSLGIGHKDTKFYCRALHEAKLGQSS